MPTSAHNSPVRAAIPIGEHIFRVICAGPIHASSTDRRASHFKSDHPILAVKVDPNLPAQFTVRIEPYPLPSFSVETLLIELTLADGSSVGNVRHHTT